MTGFTATCALAFVAALLLVSGGSHLAAPRRFARLLARQGVVPTAWTLPAATAVTAGELAIAGCALAALSGAAPGLAAVASAASLAIGGAFLFYLRHLMASGHTGSCGCTPVDAPWTPASFAPAAGLAVAGAAGLAAALAPPPLPPALAALGAGWGLTLAGLVLLLPASAPANVGWKGAREQAE
jgi:hypothetical protein